MSAKSLDKTTKALEEAQKVLGAAEGKSPEEARAARKRVKRMGRKLRALQARLPKVEKTEKKADDAAPSGDESKEAE